MWQAEDQVHADRVVTLVTHPIERLAGDVHRLQAVDRQLHLRVGVLHSKRGPVAAEFAEGTDVVAGFAGRVPGASVPDSLPRFKKVFGELAARAAGRGDIAILFRHVLPNVFHIAIINFSLGFVGAIGAEVILSFLNLGVQNLPSWGKMINEARMDLVVGRWWELSSAVIATFVIVLAWNIFGDRLRDALDPKTR